MDIKLWIFLLTLGWETNQSTIPDIELKRQAIVQEAEKFIGLKYKSKVDKTIFDCSGYARYIMHKNNINITRSSISQVHDGKKVADLKEAKPGDLLIFKGRNTRNIRPGHVGIVHHWSRDTLYFIHSSVSKGITIDHLFDPYYKNRFIQVRNVIGK
ncbi:MAG: C40 family peptidase [Saprospiraceae bacterium]|nr:C40 family peptidase [Saprospiraceae bacterium]